MRWRGPRAVIVCFTAVFLALVNPARANTAEWCENDWLAHSGQFVSKEAPDYPGLLSYWQRQADECSGTVAYEARLAAIHVYLGQQAQARAVLASVKKKESKYGHLVEFVELVADGFALADGAHADDAALSDFSQRALAFAQRYPEFAEGLAFAGGVQTTFGHHAAAIPLLEAAFAKGDERMMRTGIYRNAAVSYAALGKYDEASQAAAAGLSENKALTVDPVFMYAVIRTQAEIGMLEDARKTAELLAKNVPMVKSDPEFAALVSYLREKLRAAGG